MTKTIGFALLGVATLLALTACGETSGAVLERIPEQQEVDSGGPSTPPGTDMDVDVFVVRDVESCAIGEPCRRDDPDTRGDADCFEIELPDGMRKGFRSESLHFVPRGDERITQAMQSQCFNLVFDDENLRELTGNLTELTNRIYELSGEEILLDINIHPIASLTAEFEPFENEWGIVLPPKALEGHVRSLSRDTDFIFSVTGSRDPSGISPQVERCAGTVDDIERGLVGAGYSWFSDECNGLNALLRQWMVQVGVALHDVNGFNDAYDGDYPPCGEAEEDPTRWWPGPEQCAVDPDAPTCRDDRCEGTDDDYVRHVLTAHWPRSRSFVGNHCNNGRNDHGETDGYIDVGGVCDAFDR
jgi:hypothetical protein